MQKKVSLRLLPSEAATAAVVKKYIAEALGIRSNEIMGFNIARQSIDARGRQPMIQISLDVFINEPWQERERIKFHFPDVSRAQKTVTIIGAGPAGLFAALKLIENGIKPVILERGKDVRARRRDLAALNKDGEINPESNYCFGEGGAGTYSDGKLYTRSSKRGDVNRILNLFVHFGADERILFEAHPHIGTNKLPGIITSMRNKIIECGGEIHFKKKLVGIITRNNQVTEALTADGDSYSITSLVLATGHSARDIFHLLHEMGILIESKPFALGVRVEHPQELIDITQYHQATRDPFLPPASYSWVQQVDDKGVFSFCMCPGGIIAPAATSPGELVVNGWSPSKRNNPYANSGIVVTVDEKDLLGKKTPLAGMYFQQKVEKKAFEAGGGAFVAPAQRLVDFTNRKLSPTLPACSYLPGLNAVELDKVLPSFIYESLKEAFIAYGKRTKGYLTNEAVVVATESRTSSPVRIPRDPDTLQHPQISNLFPCGEGAGYAGGIVSAAMDGERVAESIIGSQL